MLGFFVNLRPIAEGGRDYTYHFKVWSEAAWRLHSQSVQIVCPPLAHGIYHGDNAFAKGRQ